jgi:hypothetical protein
MGCLSQRYKDELLKEIPEIDYLIGAGDFKGIAEIMESDNHPTHPLDGCPAPLFKGAMGDHWSERLYLILMKVHPVF